MEPTQNLLCMSKMMMPARHREEGMEKITSKVRVLGESRVSLLSGSEMVCESKERRLAWGFYCGESMGLDTTFPLVGTCFPFASGI